MVTSEALIKKVFSDTPSVCDPLLAHFPHNHTKDHFYTSIYVEGVLHNLPCPVLIRFSVSRLCIDAFPLTSYKLPAPDFRLQTLPISFSMSRSHGSLNLLHFQYEYFLDLSLDDGTSCNILS